MHPKGLSVVGRTLTRMRLRVTRDGGWLVVRPTIDQPLGRLGYRGPSTTKRLSQPHSDCQQLRQYFENIDAALMCLRKA